MDQYHNVLSDQIGHDTEAPPVPDWARDKEVLLDLAQAIGPPRGSGKSFTDVGSPDIRTQTPSLEIDSQDTPRRIQVATAPILFGRMLAGVVPALVLVCGAVLLTLLAMFMNRARREYALSATSSLTAMARVVVGLAPPKDAEA